jgi:hypothetical protein
MIEQLHPRFWKALCPELGEGLLPKINLLGQALLRMGSDGQEVERISSNLEIKTPPSIYPGLPNSFLFIPYLGMQGGVPKIPQQKTRLFLKSPLNLLRSLIVQLTKLFRLDYFHGLGFLNALISSLAVL